MLDVRADVRRGGALLVSALRGVDGRRKILKSRPRPNGRRDCDGRSGLLGMHKRVSDADLGFLFLFLLRGLRVSINGLSRLPFVLDDRDERADPRSRDDCSDECLLSSLIKS